MTKKNIKRVFYPFSQALIMALLGLASGIFAKWLDLMATFPDYSLIEDRVIMLFKLDRVFSDIGVWALIAMIITLYSRGPKTAAYRVLTYFLFLNLGYLWYTITFCGFNPTGYILLWTLVSLCTPLVAYVTWYAKGGHWYSYLLQVIMIMMMCLFCFTSAFDYFSFKDIITTIVFVVAVIILYEDIKQIAIVGGIGCICAYLITLFVAW